MKKMCKGNIYGGEGKNREYKILIAEYEWSKYIILRL